MWLSLFSLSHITLLSSTSKVYRFLYSLQVVLRSQEIHIFFYRKLTFSLLFTVLAILPSAANSQDREYQGPTVLTDKKS